MNLLSSDLENFTIKTSWLFSVIKQTKLDNYPVVNLYCFVIKLFLHTVILIWLRTTGEMLISLSHSEVSDSGGFWCFNILNLYKFHKKTPFLPFFGLIFSFSFWAFFFFSVNARPSGSRLSGLVKKMRNFASDRDKLVPVRGLLTHE